MIVICDRLRINQSLAANIEFTLREFKVTEPEVLRVQNLRALYVPRAIEIKLHIVHIQKLITLHRKVRLRK